MDIDHITRISGCTGNQSSAQPFPYPCFPGAFVWPSGSRPETCDRQRCISIGKIAALCAYRNS